MQKKGPVYRSPVLFFIDRILGLIMVIYTLRMTLEQDARAGGGGVAASSNLILYEKWLKRLGKAGDKNVSFLGVSH